MLAKLPRPREHILHLPDGSAVALGRNRRFGGQIIARQIVVGGVAGVYAVEVDVATVGKPVAESPADVERGGEVGHKLVYPRGGTGQVEHGHRIVHLVIVGSRRVEEFAVGPIDRLVVVARHLVGLRVGHLCRLLHTGYLGSLRSCIGSGNGDGQQW